MIWVVDDNSVFSDEELERIQRFRESDNPARVNVLEPSNTEDLLKPKPDDVFDRSTATIDENECARLRSIARFHDVNASDLLPLTGVTSPRTVCKHLRDECSHDPGVDPVECDEIEKHRVVDSDDCAEYRREVREGASIYQLAKNRDDTPTRSAVKRHVRGECTHDVDEPPVPSDTEQEARDGGGSP